MTGLELDQAMRQVFLTVTPDNVLSKTARLVELGFPAPQAYRMLEAILLSPNKPSTPCKSR